MVFIIRKVINKDYLIYAFLIIFSIYQNCPLGNYLGVFGEQPVFIVSLFIFAYLVFLRKVNIQKRIRPLFYLLAYMLFVSFIANILFLVISRNYILLGENIFIKAIKVCIIYLSYLSLLVCLTYYGKRIKINMVFRPFYLTLIIIGVLAIIEKQQIPYGLSFIPSINEYPYWRIRLLSRESSFTSTLILITSILGILYSVKYPKNAFRIVISVIFSGILVYLSGSKGLLGMIILFLVILLFKFLVARKTKLVWMLVYISMFVLAAVAIAPKIYSMIQDDIENYTSVATRAYSLYTGFLLGLVFPLGIGCALHLWAIPNAYLSNIGIFDQLKVKMNLDEIYSIINTETDYAVSVKSGFLQFNIYWGILGSFVFVFCLYKIHRSFQKTKIPTSKIFISSLFITMIIAVLFIRDFTSDFWIMLAVLNIIIEKNKVYIENIKKEGTRDERYYISGWKWDSSLSPNYSNK